MLPPELEEYLHTHIPLSRAMKASVLEVGEHSVVIGVPLKPNINHQSTVFGGSAAAAAMLAAWSLLYVRLRAAGVESQLVVQQSTLTFEKPIPGDFTARAALEEPDWSWFVQVLERKGRARIAVNAVLEFENKVAARFSGEFVASMAPPAA